MACPVGTSPPEGVLTCCAAALVVAAPLAAGGMISTHDGFLHASTDPVRQFGTEGAWLVTGHRGQRTGVAQ